MNKVSFQTGILRWYDEHKRDLPWRNFNDPYLIWISEIILQQTRVNQGLPYFHKFQTNYPTVQDLAEAPESQVLKDWEGLGYYSRARNLHTAAKQIVNDYNGLFPKTHAEILGLKGVGDYTAAAISSFAYGLPHAVVDGNVFRLLSRVYGIDTPINSGPGKKQFDALADELLDREDPATYNQAIMEFGSLQCAPKNPDCASCPLSSSCYAFQNQKVGELPVKAKKKYDRQRFFNYAYISADDQVLLQQRQSKDVWQQLYQFPLVEHGRFLEVEELITELGLGDLNLVEIHDLKAHKLSHQTIHCRVFEIKIGKTTQFSHEGAEWMELSALESMAFPRPLRKFLDRKQLTLPFKN